MQDENATDFGIETSVESGIQRFHGIGWTVRSRVFGLLVRKRSFPQDLTRAFPVEWERDEWVALCIPFGLNAREIVQFSYCWPRPITTVQQVYATIERLGLSKAYKKAQKTRTGYHNKNIAYAFTKLAGQAMSYGYRVTDVMRDMIPDERVKFRPDAGMRIEYRYWLLVEVQLSKIQATRWGVKLRNYIRLYEKTKQPFRAIFLVDRPADILKIRQYARDILREKHPDLNLFLFMTIDEFRHLNDVMRAPVWLGIWDKVKVPLVR